MTQKLIPFVPIAITVETATKALWLRHAQAVENKLIKERYDGKSIAACWLSLQSANVELDEIEKQLDEAINTLEGRYCE